MAANKYAGPCAKCGQNTPAGEGTLTGPPWRVFCRGCYAAPAPVIPSRSGVVTIRLHDGRAEISPAGYLGRDVFGRYLEAMRRSGASYQTGNKSYRAEVASVPRVVEELRAAGLEPQVAPELAASLQALAAQVREETSAASERADAVDAALRARGLALFPFQRTGVEWLAPRTGAILADDMGLGKTIQALISAPAGAPILVVCPAVAKGVWVREAAKWRPDLKPVALSGRGSFRWPVAGEMVVINYDILPEPPTAEENPTSFAGAALQPIPGCPANLVLVADEAHAVKNHKAARTARFRALSTAARAAGGRVWLLTATPLLNRPMELWSVLQAAQLQREALGNWKRFLALFDGHPGEYGGYEFGAPSDEVPELLARVMLRRVKTDVLKDLPEKRRTEIEVDLDSKTAKLCDAALGAVDLAAAVAEAKAGRYTTPSFEQLSRARAALATAKIPALLELLDSYEESGEPVVVFSAHRAPVDLVAERTGWAAITGDTSPETRTQIEADFQAGKLRGVAATIQAGGVAITLTRAAHAIFVDQAWTPALNSQAEDRIYRIGQSRGVLITVLVARHALDRRVADLLAEKAELIAATVDAVVSAPVEPELATRIETVIAESASVTVNLRGGGQADLAALVAEVAAAEAAKVAAAEAERERLRRRTPAERFKDAVVKRTGQARACRAGLPRPARTEREEWIASALVRLAVDDSDHAAKRNDVGFNKADSYLGHAFCALLREEGLDEEQWSEAARMLAKYHGQVGRAPGHNVIGERGE